MLVVPAGHVSGLAAATGPACANALPAASDRARAGPATWRHNRRTTSNLSRSIAVPFLRASEGRPLGPNQGSVEREIVEGDEVVRPIITSPIRTLPIGVVPPARPAHNQVRGRLRRPNSLSSTC